MPETPSKPTVRSLAHALGLSRTTVSDALRGSPRVDLATSRRVAEAAHAMGYEQNPLVSLLMSQIKRANGHAFHGNLAAIEISEPNRPPHGIFHEELLTGAKAAAQQLGFSLECFLFGRKGYSRPHLERILRIRNIAGVLILPAWKSPDLSGFDWSRYAAVYTGRNLETPALHFVTVEAFEAVLSALHRLAALGYRRPGLYVEEGRDALNNFRLSAALYTFQRLYPGIGFVPTLRVSAFRRDEFQDWFLRFRPDVVLHEHTGVVSWMEACGARVPDTHGFVSLNSLYCDRPCASLDLQPRAVGMRAIEQLTGQLLRNERGIPACPIAITVPALWVDGPTVQKQAPLIEDLEALKPAGPACTL